MIFRSADHQGKKCRISQQTQHIQFATVWDFEDQPFTKNTKSPNDKNLMKKSTCLKSFGKVWIEERLSVNVILKNWKQKHNEF